MKVAEPQHRVLRYIPIFLPEWTIEKFRSHLTGNPEVGTLSRFRKQPAIHILQYWASGFTEMYLKLHTRVAAHQTRAVHTVVGQVAVEVLRVAVRRPAPDLAVDQLIR